MITRDHNLYDNKAYLHGTVLTVGAIQTIVEVMGIRQFLELYPSITLEEIIEVMGYKKEN